MTGFSLRRLLGRNQLTEKLAAATGASLGVKILGAGLGFVLQVVLARVLGAETFGQYAYVLAWINGSVAFATLGFDIAAMRFVAVMQSRAQWGALRGLIRRSLQVTSATSLVGAGLLAGGVGVLYALGRVPPPLHVAFWVAAPLLPLLALAETFRGLLRGLGHVALAIGPRPVLYPLFLMAAVGLAYVLSGEPPGVTAALALSVGAGLGVVGTQLLVLREVRPAPTVEAEPEYHTREWLHASAPMAVTAGVQKAMRETDVIMVGALVGTTAAGIYAISTRLVRLTQYGVQSVNLAGAPILAELHGEDRHDALQETVFHGAKLTLALALPPFVIMFVGAPWLLRIFGENFVAGTAALRILAVAELLGVLTGSNGLLMNMAGLQDAMARIVAWSAGIGALVILALTSAFGLVGAAAGLTIGILIRNLWLVARVYRDIGINSTLFSRRAWERKEGS